jgi:hypothetical protein
MKPCPPGKDRNPTTKRCRKIKPPASRRPRVPAPQGIRELKLTPKQNKIIEETIKNSGKSVSRSWEGRVGEAMLKAFSQTGSGFMQGVVVPVTKWTLLIFIIGAGYIHVAKYSDHVHKYHTDESYRTKIDFVTYLKRFPGSRYWQPFLYKYFAKPIFFSLHNPVQPGECPAKIPPIHEEIVLKQLREHGCAVPDVSWYDPKKLLTLIPIKWLK